MTEAEAEARLRAITSASEEPDLTDADVAAMMDVSRLADAAGMVYTDAGWDPTWDLNRGAALGWTIKAGRVANRFAFDADGAKYDRNQIHQHCVAMAQIFRNKVAGTSRVRGQGALP
jgi:hypothetical protein